MHVFDWCYFAGSLPWRMRRRWGGKTFSSTWHSLPTCLAISGEFSCLLVFFSSVVNRNYFLRFRFRLLKSYGSGSGSDFWQSYGSGSGSYFWKVTVPVPVPAPYLFHKKQIFLKKFVSFLYSKLFYKEKDYKYQQIYCKMWKKKFWMKVIKYIILYLVPVPEP